MEQKNRNAVMPDDPVLEHLFSFESPLPLTIRHVTFRVVIGYKGTATSLSSMSMITKKHLYCVKVSDSAKAQHAIFVVLF